MPVEITHTEPKHVEEVDIEKLLFTDEGELTAQGEVIEAFLASVDYDDMFDAPELKDLVDVAEVTLKQDGEDLVPAEEGDEDAALGCIESVDGEIIATVIDEDDLYKMFEFWVVNEMSDETLADRVHKAVAYEMLGIDDEDIDIDETFKKGAFRKIRKMSGGAAIVNNMLGAMLNKEAIQRAKGGPGTGYKKGDYDKDPAGYGGGKASAVKKYKMIAKKAKSGASKAAATAAKKTAGKLSQFAKGGGKKKATAKKKGFAAAKKKALGLKAGKKKSIAASDTSRDRDPQVYEGSRLAGKMLNS